MTVLGLRIRQLRMRRMWNLQRTAKETGLEVGVISRIEFGATRSAPDEVLEALARALDSDPEELQDLNRRPDDPLPIATYRRGVMYPPGHCFDDEPPTATSPLPDLVAAVTRALEDEMDPVARQAALLTLRNCTDKLLHGHPNSGDMPPHETSRPPSSAV